MTDFSELSIEGRVATPGDADWDEARLAWNLAADLQPERGRLRRERRGRRQDGRASPPSNGLRVAGQGTGHGAAAAAARSTTRS